MPSTYTLNNGIELIGTGEQSGTWGDTTNTNLGLLDAALDGQVTITLAAAGSSGSPNALPITDGTTSNGRNRMVVFADGADLGATAYVQLTPNDAEKIIYIRNSLSGSRSVILFQGTYNASNDYEVPAGTTAIVYFDGAGAGAVAANVFNNAYFDGLRLGSVSVTAILDEDNMASDSATALATQQSIKAYVDSQVGTVDTLAEILAIGNTTGGTDIVASTTDKVQFRDAAIYINSSVDGQLDIVADTEIQIAATTVDLNGNLDVSGTLGVTGVLTATSLDISGDIDVDGTTNLDVVDIDGAVNMATTALVTGVLTTTAATVHNGGITMPDSVKATFGTGSDLVIWHNSADSYIQNITGNVNIQAKSGESSIVAAPDGAVTLYHDNAAKLATTATGIDVTGTVTATGTSVFASLDISGDIDVDGTTNLDVVDIDGAVDMASTLNVTGAVTGTSATLTTADNTTQLTLKSTDDDLNSGPELDFYRLSASPADNDYLGRVKYIGRNDNAQDVTAVDILARMVDVSDGTEDATYNIRVMKAGTLIDRVTLNETETILNEASADLDFRIESDTDANALFVEGSSGNVGIGTSSPSGRLQISDTFPTFILDETNTDAAYQQTMLSLSDGTFRIQTRTSTNVFVSNDYIIEKDASGATDHIWSIADSEVMRIDSSGKATIGAPTAAPITTELHVHKNAAGANISFGDESTVVISTNSTGAGGQGYIGSLWFGSQDISSVDQYGWKMAGMAGYMSGDTSATGGSADLLFYTANASQTGTERMRIKSSGDVLVATTSAGGTGGWSFYPTGSGSSPLIVVNKTNVASTTAFSFQVSGVAKGSISYTSTATAYNTSSDYRLKTDAQPMTGASARVQALKPVNFEWISSGERVDGFLAHEAQEVVPEAVHGTKDAMRG
jgi:cytoskeletal protein CcmA (bactofilin family)